MGVQMKQRVIELTEFGKAENMRLIEAEIPSPGPGQIVVKNKAIGLKLFRYIFSKWSLSLAKSRKN